jgi:hypothetical protein
MAAQAGGFIQADLSGAHGDFDGAAHLLDHVPLSYWT